ncbi:hypothetical protein SAMN04488011_101715 [Palleronia pelagia]|uniref:DUF6456 domain-containing protein n=2 Tax=Palleronia pelagia TaxID=387096 RepID=A0A1H8BV19_9RHOB|nr:hypothetical protein SAMN04488011_101715 [Palleronia pelagia]
MPGGMVVLNQGKDMTKEAHGSFGGWVPTAARVYLQHVVDGKSIRALARDADCHASTVLRQVRRCEELRDDPLIDHALRRLSVQRSRGSHPGKPARDVTMKHDKTITTSPKPTAPVQPPEIYNAARRVLRRMAEPGACLAVAEGMEKAVVVRETDDGQTIRTAVVDTPVAEALALAGWIAAEETGRITRYRIRPAGRVALKDMLDQVEAGLRADDAERDGEDTRGTGARYGAPESPLMMLSRRRDKNGRVFLTPDLVRVGERLREDFELAGLEADTDGDTFDAFMAEPSAPTLSADDLRGPGPKAARARLHAVMQDLGPGLGDVVLRACCLLEGMEPIERRMGWAARSGKIVLRIGLERLKRHYVETQGRLAPMIG